jgi:cytochrome c
MAFGWARAGAAWLALACSAPLALADPIAGEAVFRSRCAMCHSVERDQVRVGPSLAGVVGRAAGSVPSFRYSPAMRAAARTWTPETLDAFLTVPVRAVPRTIMVSGGVADLTQRTDLISYLETLQ